MTMFTLIHMALATLVETLANGLAERFAGYTDELTAEVFSEALNELLVGEPSTKTKSKPKPKVTKTKKAKKASEWFSCLWPITTRISGSRSGGKGKIRLKRWGGNSFSPTSKSGPGYFRRGSSTVMTS
jgi:hypothetical protein